MGIKDAKRFRDLEKENADLKRIVAVQTLQVRALKDPPDSRAKPKGLTKEGLSLDQHRLRDRAVEDGFTQAEIDPGWSFLRNPIREYNEFGESTRLRNGFAN